MDVIDRIGHHAWDLRWLYGVKITLVVVLLFQFRKKYEELSFARQITFNDLLIAILSGIAVFFAWINLDASWMVLGSGSEFNPSSKGTINIALVAIRFIGAVLVVPLMEELFWRSFLLRWLDSTDFIAHDPAKITLRAFFIVVVLFGFEHDLWLAGMIAAIIYNSLYIYSKNLWLPVISHSVTNALLGLWVVYTGHWEFW